MINADMVNADMVNADMVNADMVCVGVFNADMLSCHKLG